MIGAVVWSVLGALFIAGAFMQEAAAMADDYPRPQIMSVIIGIICFIMAFRSVVLSKTRRLQRRR